MSEPSPRCNHCRFCYTSEKRYIRPHVFVARCKKKQGGLFRGDHKIINRGDPVCNEFEPA